MRPVSFSSCTSLPCPKCTNQHIRIIKGPGECDECWPCSALECHEGSGSSVTCGTTIRHGTAHIHCVGCIRGANFSDRSGSDQCRPCGVCRGNHEHVLRKCTPDSDIQCECDNSFYRNKTTKECLPCASCCMSDGSVKDKCRGNGGEIGRKCNFKELYSPTCTFASTTNPVTDASVPMQEASLSLVTPSSVMISSFLHITTTPALPDNIISITPAPSENGQIKATLASVSDHARSSRIAGVATGHADATFSMGKKTDVDDGHTHWSKSLIVIVITVLLVLVIFVVFACCAAFVLKQRVWQFLEALNKKLTREGAATENDNIRGPSEGYMVAEPLLSNEPLTNGESLPLADINTAGKTTDSSNLCDSDLPVTVELPEQTTTSAELNKGIPSSLDNGPRHQGQRHRKRLASEGGDESEPCLEGYQTQLSTDSSQQDELATVTVGTSSALYHCSSPSAAPSNNLKACDLLQAASFPSISAENKGSGFSPNMSEIENHETDQREIGSFSSETPIQATEDDRDYSTHLNDVPESLIRDVSSLLDEERVIDGKDYTMLASVLGLTTPHQIRKLQELKQRGKSPSYQLLIEVFSSIKNSGTLKHLCFILEKMERHDVRKVIDDWVSKKV